MSIPIGTRVRVKRLDDGITDTGVGPLYGTVDGESVAVPWPRLLLDRPVRGRGPGADGRSTEGRVLFIRPDHLEVLMDADE